MNLISDLFCKKWYFLPFFLLALMVMPLKARAWVLNETCSATPVSITDVAMGNSGAGTEEAYLKSLFDPANIGQFVGYYKFDSWSGTETGLKSLDEHIMITAADLKTFSWASDVKVYAILVKGGTLSKIYLYDVNDCSCSATGLVAPLNKAGKQADISHVSVLYSDVPCSNEQCYSSDSAWADGARYNSKGNWATYVDFTAGGVKTVNIYAGQTKLAGTATLTTLANNNVEIKINLQNGFKFYYPSAAIDDNLKIQGYSAAPTGNPSPGLFANKYTIQLGKTSATVEVSKSKFYGIHMDVAEVVSCQK